MNPQLNELFDRYDEVRYIKRPNQWKMLAKLKYSNFVSK